MPDNKQVAQGIISVYPIPFSNNVNISFTLQEKSTVKLELFNYNGKLISTLVNGLTQQGKHKVLFEGSELPPGIYFLTLKTNKGTHTTKIIKL